MQNVQVIRIRRGGGEGVQGSQRKTYSGIFKKLELALLVLGILQYRPVQQLHQDLGVGVRTLDA